MKSRYYQVTSTGAGMLYGHPKGTRILSTDDHGKATIWDAATGEVSADLFSEDYTLGIGVIWARDGDWVVLQSVDGVVHRM